MGDVCWGFVGLYVCEFVSCCLWICWLMFYFLLFLFLLVYRSSFFIVLFVVVVVCLLLFCVFVCDSSVGCFVLGFLLLLYCIICLQVLYLIFS